MGNHIVRWIFCSLFLVVAMGCATSEPKPPPPTPQVPETVVPQREPVAPAAPAAPNNKTPEVFIPAPEPDLPTETVMVTANRLNLRIENSTKSQILGVVKKNEPLTVLARDRNWINVRTATGKLGWVAERYTAAIPIRATELTAFAEKDAVALYNRYRQTLADGNFNAFLKSIYLPAKSEGSGQAPEAPNPREFDQAKDFMLELSPDLAASQILKFSSDDKTAILVARVDPQNTDYITLGAIKFATKNGSWKVLPKFYDDTFPTENPTADKAAIEKALGENTNLQLADVSAQVKAITSPKPKSSPAAVIPPKVSPVKPPQKKEEKTAPRQSTIFNTSPQHLAIVNQLQADGETEILQTATSVGMNTQSDFATVNIVYSRNGETTQAERYLFKEGSNWVAYRELPTRKDHVAVFLTLARRYCKPRYKHLQGIGFHDDSIRSKDPQKRIIKVTCSELIDKKWQDHRLSLVYQFDPENGWGIVQDAKQIQDQDQEPVPPAAKSATSTQKGALSDKDTDQFFLSILKGDRKAVQDFLDGGLSPNVKRPRLGHSPLYTAVYGRHDQIALLLLKAGGDANFKDENGATPLLKAASNCKSIALVKALVATGADVNAKAKGGGTPLMLAEAMKCTAIVELLRKAGAK